MRRYYVVWAHTEQDARDMGERRARDAGYTVRGIDSVEDMDPDRDGLRRWVVWVAVAG